MFWNCFRCLCPHLSSFCFRCLGSHLSLRACLLVLLREHMLVCIRGSPMGLAYSSARYMWIIIINNKSFLMTLIHQKSNFKVIYQVKHKMKFSDVKDVGGCSCMSITILARQLDNTVKPRFKDAKQHSTQLAWLERCKDQEKGKLCEQESCKTERSSKTALYFDYDTVTLEEITRDNKQQFHTTIVSPYR